MLDPWYDAFPKPKPRAVLRKWKKERLARQRQQAEIAAAQEEKRYKKLLDRWEARRKATIEELIAAEKNKEEKLSQSMWLWLRTELNQGPKRLGKPSKQYRCRYEKRLGRCFACVYVNKVLRWMKKCGENNCRSKRLRDSPLPMRWSHGEYDEQGRPLDPGEVLTTPHD